MSTERWKTRRILSFKIFFLFPTFNIITRCRYSDSPTSELDNRTPKSRGKRGGRGGSGTPVENETRKNLRSSKVKGKGGNNGNNAAFNSPAKDGGGGGGKRKNRDEEGNNKGEDKKRPRTSSRNSPEDDEDSEKEKEKENDGGSEKDKLEDEDMTPKDKEDEKYKPPPPLPYSLTCPKPGCKKKYRQHNGLKFHVSAAHKELLDSRGEIRDMSEIEKMEAEAKERLRKREDALGVSSKEGKGSTEESNTEDSCPSGPSSKTSTPGPSDAPISQANLVNNSNNAAVPKNVLSDNNKAPLTVPSLGQLRPPNFNSRLPGPPPDAKPIPVSAIVGDLQGGSRPPILNGPPVNMPPVSTIIGSLPPMNQQPQPISTAAPSGNQPKPLAAKPVIRPPSNARPIVPATAPQLLAAGSLGPAINLKPIQPRPTIMPDPTPNLALDELRKKKEPKKKKDNSPGTSPPRAMNGSSPKAPLNKVDLPKSDKSSEQQQQQPAKSPAYSDISDDNDDSSGGGAAGNNKDKKDTGSSSSVKAPAFGFPFSPQLPTVPLSSVKSSPKPAQQQQQQPPAPPAESPKTSASNNATAAAAAAVAAAAGIPQPGSVEYQKILQAYGFPPMPYAAPPGIDPAIHLQLLKNDPAYKAGLEKERIEREKAFKEQIERDNRDKDRKTAAEEKSHSSSAIEDLRKLQQLQQQQQQQHHQQQQQQATLSVRPDLKMELKPEPKQEKIEAKDEGAKPTMETRGPPPATANPFGWPPSALMRPGMPGLPYDPLMAGAVNPLLLAGSQGNPFGAAGGAYLAQLQRMPGFNAAAAAELMRQAGPFGLGPPQTSGSGPGSGSTPEDLSRAKALDLIQQHAMQISNSHKIHELQERALKSPQGSSRERTTTPKSSAPSPSLGRKGTPSPRPSPRPPPASSSGPSPLSASSNPAASGGGRAGSPPSLHHVHTHTHTHFGLGYPLLPPPAAVPPLSAPPAAHSPFPAGFPSKFFFRRVFRNRDF